MHSPDPRGPPPPHTFMEHGGNVAILLADAALSRTPAVSYHFQLTLAYGTAYVVFMWAWHAATGGDWIYQSFDWNRPLAAAAYAVVPFLLAAAFGLWYGVAAGREAVGRALARRRERRKGGQGGEAPPPPHLPESELATPPPAARTRGRV